MNNRATREVTISRNAVSTAVFGAFAIFTTHGNPV
jgi:hypothetical protein